MIEKRQQAILREIADAKNHELRFRALHYLVGTFEPETEAQIGALVAAIAEVIDTGDFEHIELGHAESVVHACKTLASAYTPELVPLNAELALDAAPALIIDHLHWLHTKNGQYRPETNDPLTAIVVSGLHTIGEGKGIKRCGYCDRHIVPKRSSAAWCGPSCKSGAQYRRNRDLQNETGGENA